MQIRSVAANLILAVQLLSPNCVLADTATDITRKHANETQELIGSQNSKIEEASAKFSAAFRRNLKDPSISYQAELNALTQAENEGMRAYKELQKKQSLEWTRSEGHRFVEGLSTITGRPVTPLQPGTINQLGSIPPVGGSSATATNPAPASAPASASIPSTANPYPGGAAARAPASAAYSQPAANSGYSQPASSGYQQPAATAPAATAPAASSWDGEGPSLDGSGIQRDLEFPAAKPASK